MSASQEFTAFPSTLFPDSSVRISRNRREVDTSEQELRRMESVVRRLLRHPTTPASPVQEKLRHAAWILHTALQHSQSTHLASCVAGNGRDASSPPGLTTRLARRILRQVRQLRNQ